MKLIMKTAPDRWLAALLGGVLAAPASAAAQEDVDELARKVSNPASYMISVPIHTDIDFADSADGETERALLDIEPVLPFRLNESWNLISHTDFPLGYVNAPGEGAVFGLGDVAQTLSFTPAGRRPFIWAAGLQASLPTATSRELGSGKFSLGPSILLLRQTTALTAGLSASHLWSVAGRDDRDRVSLTELHPFLAWHIGGGRTISTNIDATYDWRTEEWDAPIGASFSQVTRLGGQMMSLSVGAKYWLKTPEDRGEWGLTAGVTLLFPQGAPATARSSAGPGSAP